MINRIKHRCYHLLPFGVFSLLCSFLVFADPLPVTFIVIKDQGIYRKIIELTDQTIRHDGLTVTTKVIEIDGSGDTRHEMEGRLVTIGTQAAAYAYDHYSGETIISALLTRSGFTQLAQQSFGGADSARRHGVVPLLLDQPLSRFFTLGAKLVPSAKTVGILVGPANEDRLEAITRQAIVSGFDVQIALLHPDNNPIQIIEPVMKSSDFFIVLPDRKQINQLAAKWVLPLSYRYKKPVIAYSQKYVEAGALASVFSSPKDVALSITDSLRAVPANTNSYAPPFSISLNFSVARSLGIEVKDPDYYTSLIRSRESLP
ncbi:MAG: hypothetical protein V7459_08500 [Oceanicoccus sp.]